MKIIQSSKNIELNFELYYSLSDVCFMDIETTGLSRKYHQIYLIGIFTYDCSTDLWNLTQFFSESEEEEALILKAYVEETKKYKYLITYNGDNFDIPFINEKLNKYNINKLSIESVDLYKILRNSKDFIEFPNLKLKTVEKELGICREDTFSGLECIEFYKNYTITQSKTFFKYLIMHNRDDLYSMPDLLKIFQIIKKNSALKAKLSDKIISLELLSIKQSGDLIILDGKWDNLFGSSAEYYSKYYSFTLNKNFEFNMKIEVNRAKLDDDLIAYYVNTIKVGLDNNIKDLSGYNPPDNILILKANKKNVLDNIKLLVKEILEFENLNK